MLTGMTADVTTIKVPKALRDELNALADEGGRGTTLADVIRQLIDARQTERLLNRQAYLEVRAAAEADPDAMQRAHARAEQFNARHLDARRTA
jgi:Arc/MetJ-type ribon-helix-helix transcriptional regulator